MSVHALIYYRLTLQRPAIVKLRYKKREICRKEARCLNIEISTMSVNTTNFINRAAKEKKTQIKNSDYLLSFLFFLYFLFSSYVEQITKNSFICHGFLVVQQY